ncbi:hypothetical protein [Curtobacterium sp. SORGH_AS_0776]|uniref:hypothetical protein n=1 Tax=Curtobacterium sp. SORGH_AS_0776 TaxID=3041798 RepID=UPI002866DD6C|nr:hypothetical protein [Curtobacterium sp. SORGH_AS_0776]MDR6171142.1 hypothetical protein [Curtobacterium sp. SORGH_AS_0776]
MITISFRGAHSGAVGLAVVGSLVAALVVAPPAVATERETNQPAGQSGLSDQDLLLIDGALFGVGPVAQQLGTSIDTVFSGDELQRIETYARDARDGLVASRASAVEQAVDDIRSGSVNTVEDGFRTLGDAFESYVEETYSAEELEAATQKYSSSAVVPMCGAVAACVAAVAFAVYAGAVVHNAAAITAAAAVLVSVYAWCGAWVGCGRGADTGTERVKHEKFLANATRVGQALPA